MKCLYVSLIQKNRWLQVNHDLLSSLFRSDNNNCCRLFPVNIVAFRYYSFYSGTFRRSSQVLHLSSIYISSCTRFRKPTCLYETLLPFLTQPCFFEVRFFILTCEILFHLAFCQIYIFIFSQFNITMCNLNAVCIFCWFYFNSCII